MTRWHDDQDDFDDDDTWDDEEDEDDATVPCPHCGRDVFEDAERCPHCARYLSREDAPPARKPWWIVVGAIACLYAIYRWTVG